MFKYSLRLAIVFSVFFGSSVSWASLITTDLVDNGDGLTTLDSITGFEWLDLTQTIGFSINDARASNWATQYGFRVANALEVSALFESAGLYAGLINPRLEQRQQFECDAPGSLCFGDMAQPTAKTATFNLLRNLGQTDSWFFTASAKGFFVGLDSTSVGYAGFSIYRLRFTEDSTVFIHPKVDGWDFDVYAPPSAGFGRGIFMVRGQVPTPTSLLLVTLGVLILVSNCRKF